MSSLVKWKYVSNFPLEKRLNEHWHNSNKIMTKMFRSAPRKRCLLKSHFGMGVLL